MLQDNQASKESYQKYQHTEKTKYSNALGDHCLQRRVLAQKNLKYPQFQQASRQNETAITQKN